MFNRTNRAGWLSITGLAAPFAWYPALTWLLGFPPSGKLDFYLERCGPTGTYTRLPR